MSELNLGPLGTVTSVRGDSFVVSSGGGDILPGGEHGLYVRDTRFLNRLRLTVDGEPPWPLIGKATGSATAAFRSYVPRAQTPDPLLHVTRRRVVEGSLHEEFIFENRGRATEAFDVGLAVGTDFAYIFDVKNRRPTQPHPPRMSRSGVSFARGAGPERCEITTTPEPDEVADAVLRFHVVLAPAQKTSICVDVAVQDVYGRVGPGARCAAFERQAEEGPWLPPPGAPIVHCSDARFVRLVEQSMADLAALRTSDPEAPGDDFLAAGTPWYLTLFGRDSIWSALMALPLDPDLAGGTLRTLARRQGRRVDTDTEEEPGKILHEIRRGSLAHRGDLPPNYYGTIDATPLFVVLASEAWRWGVSEDDVTALLPNVEAALEWMASYGDPDGDGFVEYVRRGERGLVNQGWKDSHDGVQFADGRIAQPPIALCEVQGYAYAAAVRGAELLEASGRDGGERWRAWAGALRERFRDAFWVEDDLGPYPAIALDRDGRPIDAPASNMGHLLFTGILDDDETVRVAARLGHPSLSSGWGLRTMATTTAGYNPLSYHGGSVWPHDTAIAVWGLAAAGHGEVARRLLNGLILAAPTFNYRLPELFGGHVGLRHGFPVPYPAACRPQAWAAAGTLLMLRACLGLEPRLPEGRVVLRPPWPPMFARLEVRGIPLGRGRLDVRIDDVTGVDADVRGVDVDVDIHHGGPVPALIPRP